MENMHIHRGRYRIFEKRGGGGGKGVQVRTIQKVVGGGVVPGKRGGEGHHTDILQCHSI